MSSYIKKINSNINDSNLSKKKRKTSFKAKGSLNNIISNTSLQILHRMDRLNKMN